MGEIAMSQIVSSLDDVLEHIFHVPEIPCWNTFSAYLVKRLSAAYDIFLNTGIPMFCEYAGNKTCVCNSEAILPKIFTHDSWLITIPIYHWRADGMAKLPYNFEHGGFPGADIPP